MVLAYFFVINLSNFDLVCLGNKLQVPCFLSYDEKNFEFGSKSRYLGSVLQMRCP